jgi:ABC-type multidrug transport system fused ATPase/permease subunit
MFGGPGGPGGMMGRMGGPPPGAGHGRFHGGIDEEKTDGKSKLTYMDVVRRLPKYLGAVKKWMVLGGTGVVINTVTTIVTPLMIGLATNNIIAGKMNLVTIIALVYVGLALLGWLGQYMQNLYLTYAGQGVLYKMRTQMFDHLQSLSLSFFDTNKVGRLMSRIQNDVDQLQTLVASDIINMAAGVITLIAIAIIMFLMNVQLALMSLSIVPVLFIIIFIWQQHAHKAFVKARETIALVNDQLQEDVSGIRVTQSLSRENLNFQQFDEINKQNLEASVEAVKLQAFMQPIIQILTNGAYALVLIFGGFMVLNNTMEVGTLLTFIMYVQRFTQPVMQISMMYTMVQNSLASGVRIFELLDVAPEIKDKPDAIEMPPIKGEIQFKNVLFSYDADAEILHNVNLTIKAGETVAIAGQTGAGKSSLTSLIARFYDVQQGEVLIDGYNVKNVTQDSLRRQIGIVPQDPFLFSGTVEENIKYGRFEASHEEVIASAQAAGAHDFISRLEKGYDTSVGERGSSLSAGQRQLVCMARAILANPRIMILDEATSSIDTQTERIMQASLQQVAKGRTLVIIAHRLSTITTADRIIVLENGNIKEIGNHQQLMAKQGLYFQMYQTLSAPVLEPGMNN